MKTKANKVCKFARNTFEKYVYFNLEYNFPLLIGTNVRVIKSRMMR